MRFFKDLQEANSRITEVTTRIANLKILLGNQTIYTLCLKSSVVRTLTTCLMKLIDAKSVPEYLVGIWKLMCEETFARSGQILHSAICSACGECSAQNNQPKVQCSEMNKNGRKQFLHFISYHCLWQISSYILIYNVNRILGHP